jgi:IrrE N-terminal-like domain
MTHPLSGAGSAGDTPHAVGDPVILAARALHAELLARAGVDELALPVDVGALATIAGLRVCVLPGGLAGEVVHNRSGLPVSGLLDFSSGLLYVDGREGRPRQRFTIAHEIAHEVLGHEDVLGSSPHAVLAAEAEDEPARADAAASPHQRIEAEADRFAGELLVPGALLASTVVAVGPSVPLLAARFGVSCAAMRRHLAPWLPAGEDLS